MLTKNQGSSSNTNKEDPLYHVYTAVVVRKRSHNQNVNSLLKQMTHLTSKGLLLLDVLVYVTKPSHERISEKKTTSNPNITICITKQILKNGLQLFFTDLR